MVGTTYNVQPMPPDPKSTDWFDVAPLRIGVEYRKVDPEALAATYGGDDADMAEINDNSPEGGFSDEGVSIHVCDPAEDHEYLRFDVFVDEPHYHYVDKAAGTNTIVEFDEVAHGPMQPWALGQLRTGLPAMLRHAGAGIAEQVTDEVGASVAQQVEDVLRSIGELR